MVKKGLLIFGIVGLVIVLGIIGTIAYVQQTAFKPFTGSTMLPLVETFDCVERPQPVREFELVKESFFGTAKTSVYCGKANLPGYFPLGCEYVIESDSADIYICPADTEGSKDCKLKKSLGGVFIISDVKYNQKIFHSERLYIIGSSDTKVSITPRPFVLELTSPTRGKLIGINGCTIIQLEVLFKLEESGKVIDFDKFELKPQDIPLNVVIGGINVDEPKNVIYHPTTGAIVYVTQDILGVKVCSTFEEDGVRFINQYECHYDDPEIFCLPSNPACGDSGNEVLDNPGEGKTCSKYTNIINSYVPVSADERCLIKCDPATGQTFIDETECVKITISEKECPAERPFLVSGKCVTKKEQDNLLRNECEKEGGTWIEEEKETCGLFCTMGLANPTISKESYCDKPNWVLYIVLALFALVFVWVITKSGRKSVPGNGGGRPIMIFRGK